MQWHVKSNHQCVKDPRRRVARFIGDEDGAMTLLALFIIMMITLVGGIGVDLMHNEMERTKLQNTLDRAVLAAANINQELDPESVVRDYFEKSNQTQYLRSVEVFEDPTKRRVTATAYKDVPTQFMRLMGVNTLKAPGRAQAEERFPAIEISLVMDISREINNGDKMSQMSTAGNAFTEAVLREDTADRVSLTVVPFSEHVALSPGMFDALNVNKRHDYSYCVNLDRTTYNTTELNVNLTFEQTPHFQWLDSHQNNINSNPNCPNKNHQHIRPFQQDMGELTRGFNGVSGLGSRSVYRGMKWGVALLDPSTRTLVDTLVAAGEVDPAFAGRPAAYNDEITLKTVVLMSSGENEQSIRIKPDKYDTPSELAHWNKNNLFNYLDMYIDPAEHPEWYDVEEERVSGEALLDQICTAAKNKGIVIFAVAFDSDDPFAHVLQKCASSASHFYRVYGDELVDALFQIGSQVTRLRLTN